MSAQKPRDPYRRTGTVLNEKYELIEYVGGGGMGAVYRAFRKGEDDIVAVKILKPDMVARSPEYAELFEKEVANARSLNHPHIVQVFDGGSDDDLSYMVMEWVEGRSVEDILTQGYLPINRLMNIFEQICSAVAFAHERSIIHLDIKPGNILLLDRPGAGDFVKVIDFGLSRVISKESGTTVTKFRGTYQYCAPEQFAGKVSYRSDIYSLGATLYYLLTGVIPFGASYINAKIHPNLELPAIPSVVRTRNLPDAVDYVLKKALNKNPALRQQSAKELFQEFHKAVQANNPPSEFQWQAEIAFEKRLMWTMVTISLLILIGLAIYPSSPPPVESPAPYTSSATPVPQLDRLLQTGSVFTGRITTSRGIGVSHMFVTLSRRDDRLGTEIRVTTTTDDRGGYYMTHLADGQYDIELYKLDYASKVINGLSITPASVLTKDISLLPSDMTIRRAEEDDQKGSVLKSTVGSTPP